MKIALAQINPVVGDLLGNSRKILEYAHQAASDDADLVIFPELCVTGYPPMDLLENGYFIEATTRVIDWIGQEAPPDTGILIGAPVRNRHRFGKRLFNAALLYENGVLRGEAHKTLLPTYDVFDEYRYFEPGQSRNVLIWRGLRLGVHICEDMWNNEEQAPYHLYKINPLDDLASLGADLLINISASPFALGKHETRNCVLEEIARAYKLPFVLVNQVGANTEIIFDGDSRVHDGEGNVILCAPSFEESLLLWDTSETLPVCRRNVPVIADLHDALVLGVRDYVDKTGAFERALVGLSGGIDSAVTCAIAAEALGPHRVMGVTMPSEFSSEGSRDDSRALAETLGIEFHEIGIGPAVDAFGEMLGPLFRGTDWGVAEENIQARSRGVTLMAISNKFNYLLLTTGNKSELAVGYATLYGDMSGGLAVLADVLKTQVYRLAEYINEKAGREIIPRSTIEKPPSAELRPDQKDEDSLPPYTVLDDILARYIEDGHDADAIVRDTGYDMEIVSDVLRKVDRNEYKRRQAPPGLRVTSKAFGVGRRLPIVMQWNREMLREIQSEPVFSPRRHGGHGDF